MRDQRYSLIADHSFSYCDVQVKNGEYLDIVAELLAVPRSSLENALCKRKMVVRGQEIIIALKPVEALDYRDALSKALYGRLFTWLVNTINSKLSNFDKSIAKNFIGVLDIFGFENFKACIIIVMTDSYSY